MKIKTYLGNLALIGGSLLIGLVIVEIAFRVALFSGIPAFESLRKPDNYADYFYEDDYWHLAYRFGHKPPRRVHPVLGWGGDFAYDTYLHNEAVNLHDRRPVLLYGDSFAGCTRKAICFQDILNNDEEFSKEHYLLNYGVGNYGVDQIFLLFHNSVDLYEDPFVVMSFMTLDLDRSLLKVRIGPKPYFRLEGDILSLEGVPIDPSAEAYFAQNPPKIKSYIYRRLLYGYLPEKAVQFLRPEVKRIDEAKALNEKIILAMIEELRDKNIDFVFLVFHPHWPGVSTLDSEGDWRDPFVKQLLEENEVPYIWSKALFQQDSEGRDYSFGDYIVLSDGHPTSHFNELIANEIKRYVLATSND